MKASRMVLLKLGLAPLLTFALAQAATFNIANGDVAGLIAAIQTANTNGQPNVINLAPKGTYTLTAVAESSETYGASGPAGLPYIQGQITINGNGATIQRSSAPGTPSFAILVDWLGGGIHCLDYTCPNGNLTLDGVTITGGSGDAGGLGITNGATLIRNSTITQNAGDLGGFYGGAGGGIMNVEGLLTIVNSTISYNTSTNGFGGGGILQVGSGTTVISFSTIFENRHDGGVGDSIATAYSGPGSVAVKNSILASPTRGLGRVCWVNYGGAVVSSGHNIAGDTTCGFSGPGDMNNTNPLLGPTTNNGGPTPTDFPAANSPAIGAVPLGYCTDVFGNPVTTDQRGFPRQCPTTIGSVEFEGLYHICLLYDPTKAAPSGSTDPIKFYLCDANTNDLSSSAIVVHATGVTQISTSISGPVQSAGNANPDSDFRFDSTLGPTGGYIFNLSTSGLATGTYNLNFTVTGDSFVYAAPFQVK